MSQDSSFVNNDGGGGGGISTEAQAMLDNFWQKAVDEIKNLTPNDFKNQELPLARIKKIMKLDDDVKVMVGCVFYKASFVSSTNLFTISLHTNR